MNKNLVNVLQDQEDELDYQLDKTARKLADAYKTQDIDTFNSLVPIIMGAFFLFFRKMLPNTELNIVDVMARVEHDVIKNYLPKSSKLILSSFSSEVDSYVTNYKPTVLTQKYGKTTLLHTINTIEKGTTEVVRSIVGSGVNDGLSAHQIAQNIQQYIRPTNRTLAVGPYDYFRNMFSTYKVNTKNIPPGSVSYNAFRIARTESTRVYQQTTVDLHEDKPWTNGFKWNLSNSHPKFDVCNFWATADNGMGAGVYDEPNLPTEHPNGFCYITVNLVSKKDFKKYLDTDEMPPQDKYKGKPMSDDDWDKFRKSNSYKQIRAIESGKVVTTAAQAKALIKIYSKSEAGKVESDQMALSLAKKYNGELASAKIKGAARIIEKSNADYKGDTGRVKDFARSTVLVKKDDMQKVFKKLQDSGLGETSAKDVSDGIKQPYRRLMVTYKTKNGTPAEVQVTTKKMFEAKMTQGDKLYDQWREIDAVHTEREFTPSEVVEMGRLDKEMRNLYEKAWRASP